MIDHIERYHALGWQLCAIAPGRKMPVGAGWQVTPRGADYWTEHPHHGVGLIHWGSGTCCLDIDDLDATRVWLAERGVDLGALWDAGVRIDSGKANRGKLVYRLPHGADGWTRHQIKGPAGQAMLDLRTGKVQDVLPPTMHPDTGRAYAWCGDPDALPTLPHALAAIWADLERKQNASVSREAAAAPLIVRDVSREAGRVIDRFNEAASIDAILGGAGYERIGARWLCPTSSSGDPGVVLLPDQGHGARVYSHHGSDVLADGHAHDPFSVYTLLAHNGDVHAAVRAAGNDLDWQHRDGDLREVDAWIAGSLALQPVAAPEREEAPRLGELPVPAARRLWAWLYGQTHAPKPAAITQAALALVCHAAARRYVGPHGQSLAVWMGITDTSSAGLDGVLAAVREAVGMHMQDRAALRGTSLASSVAVYRHLLRCPRMVWASDELGHMVTMARRQQSGAYESALAALAATYEGRTLYVDPETAISGQKERAIEECQIVQPAVTLMAFVAHDQLGALAMRGEYGRGTLQRLAVTEAGEADTATGPIPWPDSVAQVVAALGSGALAGIEAHHVDPGSIVVQWDSDAWQHLQAERRRWAAAIEGDDTTRGWRGLAHGYAQTAIRVASALAAWEAPQAPRVGLAVASWAASWAWGCLAGLLPRIELSASESGAPDAAQRIEAAMRDAGSAGITQRELARRCRPFRTLDAAGRDRVLAAMVGDGLCHRLTSGQSVRYTHHTHAKGAR
jgi:hypothetical protein